LQILWINLVTNGLRAQALWWYIGWVGPLIGAVVLSLGLWGGPSGDLTWQGSGQRVRGPVSAIT
jgi:hypothetical protein